MTDAAFAHCLNREICGCDSAATVDKLCYAAGAVPRLRRSTSGCVRSAARAVCGNYYASGE